MQRRSLSRVALVVVGLAGVVAASTATALATRSAASTFELVFNGRYELVVADGDVFYGWRVVGTFTSGAPFCESGTVDDLDPLDNAVRSYTCTDGSGSLTLKIVGQTENIARGEGEWTIVEGSGRYEGMRGKGTYSGEFLGGDPFDLTTVVFRTTLQGFADADAVAPSLAFTSASATKLRRPADGYLIRVALSLRDDVEGNTVAYRLSVTEGPEHPHDRRLFFLTSKEGSTVSGSVSTTLRVFPFSTRVRSVQLRLSGADPVGNEVSLVRSLRLPR